VDTLAANNINILFTVGGDGTMRGARAIADEVKARGLKIAVIGIPKTIDNDIPYVRRSFGFQTAVETAEQAITCAHVEATGVRHGIGIVKLMGRNSGHIAAHATLASGDVNYCWVPEVPLYLEGPGGLFELLEKRLRAGKVHALIVVAEGAGQYYFPENQAKDASGNNKLGDIGVYIKKRLVEHFNALGLPVQPRYIDPSYMIRSAPANSNDSLFCTQLAQNAVHAAMSGRTSMLVGYWHGRMTHVPLKALEGQRQDINPGGEIWLNVLHATGQPNAIGSVEHIKP
jgi:6-phosphofructokinase 1